MLPSLATKLHECFLRWDPAAQLLCVLISGVLHMFLNVLNPSIPRAPKRGCVAAHIGGCNNELHPWGVWLPHPLCGWWHFIQNVTGLGEEGR